MQPVGLGVVGVGLVEGDQEPAHGRALLHLGLHAEPQSRQRRRSATPGWRRARGGGTVTA